MHKIDEKLLLFTFYMIRETNKYIYAFYSSITLKKKPPLTNPGSTLAIVYK